MALRNIITIDEEKCDGCGLCVNACHEGAIALVGGKARLVSDTYCDGLGACVGDCPRGAIRVEQREAALYSGPAPAVAARSAGPAAADATPATPLAAASAAATTASLALAPTAAVPPRSASHTHGGCTSCSPMTLAPEGDEADADAPLRPAARPIPSPESALRNWPVQLTLVPPTAPWLRGADLLLAADCAPFAMADFHDTLLGRKTLLIGCPKLDDAGAYVEKLAEILTVAAPRRMTVARMEVPCCGGLVAIAKKAMAIAGVSVPLDQIVLSLRGRVLRVEPAAVATSASV